MFWTPLDIILVALVIALVFIVAAIMADNEKDIRIDRLSRRVDRLSRHKT